MAAVALDASTRSSLDFELSTLNASTGAQPVALETPADLNDSRRQSWLSKGEPESVGGLRSRRESFREFEAELPPVDGGVRAWSFLAASYVLEVLVWGVPLANGIFLEYYEREVFPDSPSSLLPLIGTLASGINYLLALVTMPFFVAFPRWRQPAMYFGLVMCIAGQLGASFSDTPMQLLMTQGLVLAIGGSLMYWSAATYLWEWWVDRRGMAVGVLFSGTGIGGFVVPLIIDVLLRKYGHRTTLRAMAVAFTLLTLTAVPFIRGRVPDKAAKVNRRLSFTFMKKRVFWFLLFISTVQGAGNFAPQLFLPTFATTALGMSAFQGTLVLSLMNFSSGIGYPVFGHISDKHPHWGLLACSTISVLSTFFLWGFATSLPTLIIFALIFGFASPAYGAFWSAFTQESAGTPSETILLFSIFVASKGAGTLFMGPVASALLSSSEGSSFVGSKGAFGVEHGRWAAMILFSGLCAIVGALAAASGFIPKGRLEQKMIEERAE